MRRRISSVPTRLPGSEFKNQTVRSIDPNAALVLHTKSYTGTRGGISVEDPRSVRQQHRDIQDGCQSDGLHRPGYDSLGDTLGKEEGRRRVAAPQRPRLSIHLSSILQADSRLQDYSFQPNVQPNQQHIADLPQHHHSLRFYNSCFLYTSFVRFACLLLYDSRWYICGSDDRFSHCYAYILF